MDAVVGPNGEIRGSHVIESKIKKYDTGDHWYL